MKLQPVPKRSHTQLPQYSVNLGQATVKGRAALFRSCCYSIVLHPGGSNRFPGASVNPSAARCVLPVYCASSTKPHILRVNASVAPPTAPQLVRSISGEKRSKPVLLWIDWSSFPEATKARFQVALKILAVESLANNYPKFRQLPTNPRSRGARKRPARPHTLGDLASSQADPAPWRRKGRLTLF
ncbi:hypothetical protein L596_026175 [Steinernema carpocapsae]|uniref:Uncharacterized protein n=1 Tax=Steinernema carpocapsae TaxID=34508 RepID=A0A4U5M0K8_STECR|nr:hypothetical protein L596_026175 [Steinernema carpocapsae]